VLSVGVDGLSTGCHIEKSCANFHCGEEYYERSDGRIQLHCPDRQIVLSKDVCKPIPTTTHYRLLSKVPRYFAINPVKQSVAHNQATDQNLLRWKVQDNNKANYR